MVASRIVLIAVIGIAALYGTGLYYEQNAAGPHCCGLTWPSPDPAQAERLMAKDDPKGANPTVQRRAAITVLATRPMEASGWLRLAYADGMQHGGLTDEGRHAVEMSYLVLPYAGAQAPWRLGFALENWGNLNAQTRMYAAREMEIVKTDGSILAAVTAKVARLQNPAGRLAAALLLSS